MCDYIAVLQTISPNETVFVPLGQNATFSCTMEFIEDAQFILADSSGETIERFSLNDEGSTQFPERNVFSEIAPGIFILHVLSSSENNNTQVKCRDISTRQESDSVPIVAIGNVIIMSLAFSSL